MKKLLILVVLLVLGYFGWQQWKSPTLDGKTVPPESKVTWMARDLPRFDITDRLEKDVWTVILFHSEAEAESRALLRELEPAIRTKHESVRLVVVPIRGTDAPVAQQHGITEIPTTWVFNGYGKRGSSEAFLRRAILLEDAD